jgi:hypothetical protein
MGTLQPNYFVTMGYNWKTYPTVDKQWESDQTGTEGRNRKVFFGYDIVKKA